MRRKDQTRAFGIIGIILIATAFIIWGLVMPALNKSLDQDKLNTVTDRPLSPQTNRGVPVTDAPIPPHP